MVVIERTDLIDNLFIALILELGLQEHILLYFFWVSYLNVDKTSYLIVSSQKP